MKRLHSFSRLAAAFALACAAPIALAQTAPPPQNQPGVTHAPPFRTTPQAQTQQQLPARIPKASASSNVKGQHDMAGTVQSVDPNGMVQVQTGLGNLTVHFPNAAQNLKKGDKIILHLSYSMDTSGATGPAASK
ncbi:MAG: hypothetical protein OJF61_000281 [Rhodanobacteraceae bacterium]|jgi:translation initiation factor IF-1|nr:MAG: hypothetical protein OJF61_000281 [Rhodanobacteraceae bacterium]